MPAKRMISKSALRSGVKHFYESSDASDYSIVKFFTSKYNVSADEVEDILARL